MGSMAVCSCYFAVLLNMFGIWKNSVKYNPDLIASSQN
jgi:hypothetical protein